MFAFHCIVWHFGTVPCTVNSHSKVIVAQWHALSPHTAMLRFNFFLGHSSVLTSPEPFYGEFESSLCVYKGFPNNKVQNRLFSLPCSWPSMTKNTWTWLLVDRADHCSCWPSEVAKMQKKNVISGHFSVCVCGHSVHVCVQSYALFFFASFLNVMLMIAL